MPSTPTAPEPDRPSCRTADPDQDDESDEDDRYGVILAIVLTSLVGLSLWWLLARGLRAWVGW